MDNIEIFQIDAFTDKVFHGNPAAVCVLKEEWLNDELLQAIAVENNLSETAFIIATPGDKTHFQIRWFTPQGEINLCGHATLAAAFVLFELRRCPKDVVHFSSLGGHLSVRKIKKHYRLDFPRLECISIPASTLDPLINQPYLEAWGSDLDYVMLLEDEEQVFRAQVDLKALQKLPKRGLILTARSSEADFYSRCFYPKQGIPEDPVTGSAHCVLAPFWAERLGKNELQGIQGSFRQGEVFCEVEGDRVHVSGSCRWYMKGTLVI